VVWDQPGRFKVRSWLIGGDLATYNDGLAWGRATGLRPNVEAVRSYRTKHGMGSNLEQQLAPGLGK
jgi:high affinity Mn2+ porin